MAEVTEAVKEGEQTPAVPATAEEAQVPTASEGVKPQEQEEEKDWHTLYENAKRATQEERAKRKEAEAEARRLAEERSKSEDQPESDDEGVKRFLKTEALTELNSMANYDVFVKDNYQAIQDEIKRNPVGGAEAAITRLKASVMDNLLKANVPPRVQNPANLTPTATPEERVKSRVFKDGSEEDLAVQKQLEERLSQIR